VSEGRQVCVSTCCRIEEWVRKHSWYIFCRKWLLEAFQIFFQGV